ncbi:MAG: universal stress protein [Nitrospira sp.]|nr:universal stress protein [Nitrospira sp.]
MNAVIGVDGSKYSEWAQGWLGRIPFRVAPQVMAIHTIDLNSARIRYLVRQIPRVGAAAKEILRVVSLERPDLIVTGAKGRSAVARFLQEASQQN